MTHLYRNATEQTETLAMVALLGKRDADMAAAFPVLVREGGIVWACGELVRALYNFSGWWMDEAQVEALMAAANDTADRLIAT